jgi:tripartite-type tricarboxylate transporter receptor subunit TctC
MFKAVLAHAAVALAALAASAGALAQSFPSRAIALVVGSAPSSAPDIYARVVAEQMTRALGQQVVVETRTGANGNVAADFVSKAPADGHTLWVPAQSQIEINPSAYPSLSWDPAQFVGVIKGAEAPLVLVTHPSVPAKTLAEVVAWVKANPGKVSYGSFSPGTTSHFVGYLLNERFGLDMTHVTFRGSGPQVQNLLGGHVPLGFSQIQTGLPHIRSGKLTGIVTTGATRWRQLPELPTMAELGYPEMTATTWFGLMARSATPPEVLARLIEAARKAHTDPAVKDKLESMGFDVPAQTGPQLTASIRQGTERWARLVKATGFKASE